MRAICANGALTAVHLLEVGLLREGGGVAERDEDDAVVDERRERVHDGGLLAAARGRGRDEDAGELAGERAREPLLAGGVPERLPLGGEVAVAGGDAEQEGVVLDELLRGDDGEIGLRRGVHLGEDLLGECLGHSAVAVSRGTRVD